MADALFSLSSAPGITNKIGVKSYKTTAPLAEVGTSPEFNPPHTAQREVVLPGLDPVPHIIKVFSTPGFPVLGTLLHEFWFDVKNNRILGESVFTQVDRGINGDPVFGDDPPAGSNEWINPYFDQKTIKGFWRKGSSFQVPNIEWEIIPGGGIRLLGGYVFEEGEWLMAEIEYSSAVTENTSSSDITDIITIDSDTLLDSTYRGKAIELEGLATRLSVTLEPISAVPEKTSLTFFCQGGAQYQTLIKANGSDVIKFRGADVSEIVVGLGETLRLYRKGGIWRVIVEPRGYDNLLKYSDYHDKEVQNAILCDAVLRNGDDWPRIYKRLQELPPEYVIVDNEVSDSDYTHPDNAPGMWVISGINKDFRSPNLQNSFRRALKSFAVLGPAGDSERPVNYPGGGQVSQNKRHKHSSEAISRRGYPRDSGDRTTDYYLIDKSRDSAPNHKPLTMGEEGGDEARPVNTGVFVFVHV